METNTAKTAHDPLRFSRSFDIIGVIVQVSAGKALQGKPNGVPVQADIAALSGVNLMWVCYDGSAVRITAATHLEFSYPHKKYIDLDGSLDLKEDIVVPRFIIDEGLMRPKGGAGLGYF